MYVRSRAGLGQAEAAIDVNRAVDLNRHYARALGWQPHLDHIRRLLGFDGNTPDEREFAKQVAWWQQSQRLATDGIIGRDTWTRMKAVIATLRREAASVTAPASVPSVARAAPRLIKREDTPPVASLYVDIDLDIRLTKDKGKTVKVRPFTGIFIPDNYSPKPEVDLILYLHGYSYPCLGADALIDEYWKFPAFAFREGVNDSGKNVILVTPTLGPKSQAGSLTTPGGFDAYLDQVMAALVKHGPYQKAERSPVLGNIILACHSGGGSPMLRIARSRDRYTANIRECWGFDCLYSGYADKERTKKLFTQPAAWTEWAKSNKTKRLFIYFKGSTRQESEYLYRRVKHEKIHDQVFVEKSNANHCCGCVPVKGNEPHCCVPITHWKDRFRGAQFLSNR